jgi:hypothetical protein
MGRDVEPDATADAGRIQAFRAATAFWRPALLSLGVPSPRWEVASLTAASEAAILSRVIEPDQRQLPAGLARRILRWEFPDADRRRMHELLEKAKAKKLTRRERAEAENCERVGHFLAILQSKARTSLRGRDGR